VGGRPTTPWLAIAERQVHPNNAAVSVDQPVRDAVHAFSEHPRRGRWRGARQLHNRILNSSRRTNQYDRLCRTGGANTTPATA
jgi:hypothetical protein